MAEYLSVKALSERSGIPRTTVRRWLKRFDMLLVSDLVVDDGGVERVVYHPLTVVILEWIKNNRELGHELEDMKTELMRTYVSCYYKDYNLYSSLASKVNNASLWQRIFRKW